MVNFSDFNIKPSSIDFFVYILEDMMDKKILNAHLDSIYGGIEHQSERLCYILGFNSSVVSAIEINYVIDDHNNIMVLDFTTTHLFDSFQYQQTNDIMIRRSILKSLRRFLGCFNKTYFAKYETLDKLRGYGNNKNKKRYEELLDQMIKI